MNSKSALSQGSQRRLRRFFSETPLSSSLQKVSLGPEETRHLRQTLRLKPGETCFITDGRGHQAEARIESFHGSRCDLRITHFYEAVEPSEEALRPLDLRVAVSLPQRSKMEWIVEKAQELGVDELIPVVTDRTSYRIARERQPAVLARWHRICREAAKQSGVLRVLRLPGILSIEEVLKDLGPEESMLLFHPGPEATALAEWACAQRSENPWRRRILAWIGPEGGFSDREVARLRECGAVQLRLGASLLKVETALVAVAAFLKFYFIQKGISKA